MDLTNNYSYTPSMVTEHIIWYDIKNACFWIFNIVVSCYKKLCWELDITQGVTDLSTNVITQSIFKSYFSCFYTYNL